MGNGLTEQKSVNLQNYKINKINKENKLYH